MSNSIIKERRLALPIQRFCEAFIFKPDYKRKLSPNLDYSKLIQNNSVNADEYKSLVICINFLNTFFKDKINNQIEFNSCKNLAITILKHCQNEYTASKNWKVHMPLLHTELEKEFDKLFSEKIQESQICFHVKFAQFSQFTTQAAHLMDYIENKLESFWSKKFVPQFPEVSVPGIDSSLLFSAGPESAPALNGELKDKELDSEQGEVSEEFFDPEPFLESFVSEIKNDIEEEKKEQEQIILPQSQFTSLSSVSNDFNSKVLFYSNNVQERNKLKTDLVNKIMSDDFGLNNLTPEFRNIIVNLVKPFIENNFDNANFLSSIFTLIISKAGDILKLKTGIFTPSTHAKMMTFLYDDFSSIFNKFKIINDNGLNLRETSTTRINIDNDDFESIRNILNNKIQNNEGLDIFKFIKLLYKIIYFIFHPKSPYNIFYIYEPNLVKRLLDPARIFKDSNSQIIKKTAELFAKNNTFNNEDEVLFLKNFENNNFFDSLILFLGVRYNKNECLLEIIEACVNISLVQKNENHPKISLNSEDFIEAF